jgi:drug/metabolite transporter (DMT)-like permease
MKVYLTSIIAAIVAVFIFAIYVQLNHELPTEQDLIISIICLFGTGLISNIIMHFWLKNKKGNV